MQDAAESSERPIAPSAPDTTAVSPWERHPGPGDRGSRSLSVAALMFVAAAAVMGWGASFVGLHEYGMQSMAGFTYWSAWLVPATFDGAAFACTLMTYRSSINGRSAVRGRVLMWAFTGVSSWINWIHQPSHEAQIVAAGLPIAAVAVFDVVLLELRADYEAKHGLRGFRLRPGLLVLRWLVDRRSTSDAFRKQVIDIPVEEIAGLGTLAPPGTQRAALQADAGSAEAAAVPATSAAVPATVANPAAWAPAAPSAGAPRPHESTSDSPFEFAEPVTAPARTEAPAEQVRATAGASAAAVAGTTVSAKTGSEPGLAVPDTKPAQAKSNAKKTGVKATAKLGDSEPARTGAAGSATARAESAGATRRNAAADSATGTGSENSASAADVQAGTADAAPAEWTTTAAKGTGTQGSKANREAATVTIELPKVEDASAEPAAEQAEPAQTESTQQAPSAGRAGTTEQVESAERPEQPEKPTTAEKPATTGKGRTSAKSTSDSSATGSGSEGTARTAEPSEGADPEDQTTVSPEDAEMTLQLPPVPDQPMSDRDKRSAARRDFRQSLEAERPVNGAQLGKRYGLSESWGRRQINAVRKSIAQEQAQDPAALVGSDKR